MLHHQQKCGQRGRRDVLRARLAGDPQAQRVLPLAAPGRSHHAFQPVRRLKAVRAFRGLTKHIGHAVIGVVQPDQGRRGRKHQQHRQHAERRPCPGTNAAQPRQALRVGYVTQAVPAVGFQRGKEADGALAVQTVHQIAALLFLDAGQQPQRVPVQPFALTGHHVTILRNNNVVFAGEVQQAFLKPLRVQVQHHGAFPHIAVGGHFENQIAVQLRLGGIIAGVMKNAVAQLHPVFRRAVAVQGYRVLIVKGFHAAGAVVVIRGVHHVQLLVENINGVQHAPGHGVLPKLPQGEHPLVISHPRALAQLGGGRDIKHLGADRIDDGLHGVGNGAGLSGKFLIHAQHGLHRDTFEHLKHAQKDQHKHHKHRREGDQSGKKSGLAKPCCRIPLAHACALPQNRLFISENLRTSIP